MIKYKCAECNQFSYIGELLDEQCQDCGSYNIIEQEDNRVKENESYT